MLEAQSFTPIHPARERESMSTHTFTRSAGIAGAAVAALLVAGCSSGSGSGGEATVAEDCTPLHEFETIQEGTLTVAAFNSPPKFHALSDSGPYEGIDATLISAFAAENCLEVNFKPMTGPAAQLDLRDGKSDLMGGLILKSPERAEVFNQSEGYITLETVGITSSTGIDSIDGLADKRAGVISGSTYAEPLKEALGAANVEEYQSDVNAFEDLKAGRIDAIVWQTMQGRYHSRTDEEYETLVVVEDENQPVLTGMLENNWPQTKGNDALTAAVDDFYDRVKEDGTLAEVLIENGFDEPELYISGRD